MNLMPYMRSILICNQNNLSKRYIHASVVHNKRQSGIYRAKQGKIQYLTYEMANHPHYLAVRKSWNSWNTSNIKDGNRPSETAVEDMFIRHFLSGTWPNFRSEIIIKRQHNMIRIAVILLRKMAPGRVYFLMGYTETILSYLLHCPVKMELVTTPNMKDTLYKII